MTPYYDLDGVTIYHGDCREILPEIPDVGLVLTDPPYGVGHAEWDEKIYDPRDWLVPLFGRATTILVTPGNSNLFRYPEPTWICSWFRPGSVQRAANGGFSHWEPVLVYGEHRFAYDAKRINANTKAGKLGHPCAKPLELFLWLAAESKTEGTVLDPFVGSGTALVAAKMLGRRAIGIDVEERYCEIAVERLRQTVLFSEADFDFVETRPLPIFEGDDDATT